jgi:hypothetical protein
MFTPDTFSNWAQPAVRNVVGRNSQPFKAAAFSSTSKI